MSKNFSNPVAPSFITHGLEKVYTRKKSVDQIRNHLQKYKYKALKGENRELVLVLLYQNI